MSKLGKVLAILALAVSAIAATSGTADARWHHGWYGGGWGPGWAWGYPYYRPYYYAGPPACGYTRVRAWRHGHWIVRRVWRCW